MTIAGLPAHVEAVLTTLLADRHVKSWTVAGEGQDAVFVLRLNSSQQDQRAAITTGYWKQKSAAPVRRDRTRAEDRQSQRQRQVGVCGDTFDSKSNASVKEADRDKEKQNMLNQSTSTSDSNSARASRPPDERALHAHVLPPCNTARTASDRVGLEIAGGGQVRVHGTLARGRRNNSSRTRNDRPRIQPNGCV